MLSWPICEPLQKTRSATLPAARMTTSMSENFQQFHQDELSIVEAGSRQTPCRMQLAAQREAERIEISRDAALTSDRMRTAASASGISGHAATSDSSPQCTLERTSTNIDLGVVQNAIRISNQPETVRSLAIELCLHTVDRCPGTRMSELACCPDILADIAKPTRMTPFRT